MPPAASASSSGASITALAVTGVVVAATSAGFWWYQKHKTSPVTVSALYIYPVKSCAPLPLRKQAVATALGFHQDRVYQVVTKSKDGTTYEFCTPRDKRYANLFYIQPVLLEKEGGTQLVLTAPNITPTTVVVPKSGFSGSGGDDNKKTTIVTTAVVCGPSVQAEDCGDAVAAWLDEVLLLSGVDGKPMTCRLVSLSTAEYQRSVVINPDQDEALPDPAAPPPVSWADEAPYHLTTTCSLADLNRRLKARGKPAIPMNRFRPNIVLSGGSTYLQPWEEDTWKRIKIRGVEFHVWQRTGRCTMTTIDRTSLDRGPEPLATLSTFRERAHGQRNFGMHLIPVIKQDTAVAADKNDDDVSPTMICVGDKVEVLEYDEERLAEWKKLFG